MSKGNKILEEIHPLHIIREVQKWPVLYVKDSPERANLHFKNKIWREVAKALFSDWESFNNEEKDQKVLDLTKKWRNLRDTFQRQLAIERKIREGHQTGTIRKKTYVYFKHMLYLLPHVKTTDPETSDPAIEPKLDEYFNTKGKRKAHKKLNKLKYVSTSTSNSVDDDEIDEDRHFLMSLVPSFKKMTDDEKLTAKVEILKVIKDVRKKSIAGSSRPIVDALSYDIEDDGEGVKIETDSDESDQTDQSDHSKDNLLKDKKCKLFVAQLKLGPNAYE